ncbi:MAG: hypothetical protein RL223_3767, partial [Pseudomonadota bacterium]
MAPDGVGRAWPATDTNGCFNEAGAHGPGWLLV